MDDSLLKLEIENLRELLRLKSLNKDLIEINHSILERLSKKLELYGDVLEPELVGLLERSNQILREIQFADQPKFDRSNNTPQNGQHPLTISL